MAVLQNVFVDQIYLFFLTYLWIMYNVRKTPKTIRIDRSFYIYHVFIVHSSIVYRSHFARVARRLHFSFAHRSQFTNHSPSVVHHSLTFTNCSTRYCKYDHVIWNGSNLQNFSNMKEIPCFPMVFLVYRIPSISYL